jgi:hypothetical protein
VKCSVQVSRESELSHPLAILLRSLGWPARSIPVTPCLKLPPLWAEWSRAVESRHLAGWERNSGLDVRYLPHGFYSALFHTAACAFGFASLLAYALCIIFCSLSIACHCKPFPSSLEYTWQLSEYLRFAQQYPFSSCSTY